MYSKHAKSKITIRTSHSSLLLFAVLLLGSLTYSCSTTTAPMKVLSPAAFAVPENIKTIGLVNRSIPKKNFGNVLEGMLTGEGLFMDRDAARNSINGVIHQLNDSPRFKAKATNVELKGTGIGRNFGSPLPLSEVKALCMTHQVDALLVLEAFDSDRNETVEIRNNGDGQDFLARQITTVQLGWRLYDPKEQMLIDEFMAFNEHEWNDAAASNDLAEKLFPAGRGEMNQACYDAGRAYAARISPTYTYLRRTYYRKAKGNKSMKAAAKLAQKGKWDKAAEIWSALSKTAEPKVAGKAAYNMAVVNEFNGNIPVAYDWAKVAYSDHGFSSAKPYLFELKERLQHQQMLKDQLN